MFVFNKDVPVECQKLVLQQLSDKQGLVAKITCESVCTLWQKLLQNDQNYVASKQNFFAITMEPQLAVLDPRLIQAFGSEHAIYMLPKLDLGSKPYPDCILPQDMQGLPVRRGCDRSQRLFFCLNIKSIYVDGLLDARFALFDIQPVNPNLFQHAVITIFWPHAHNAWVVCANNCSVSAFGDNETLRDTHFKAIGTLLKNQFLIAPCKFSAREVRIELIDEAQASRKKP